MQTFYNEKIESRLDLLEDMLQDQIRTSCDILANVNLVRYLQAFKDIDNRQQRAPKAKLNPQES